MWSEYNGTGGVNSQYELDLLNEARITIIQSFCFLSPTRTPESLNVSSLFVSLFVLVFIYLLIFANYEQLL